MTESDLLKDLDQRAATAAVDIKGRAAARPAPAFDPTELPALAPVTPLTTRRLPSRLVIGIAAAVLLGGGLGIWAEGTGGGGKAPAVGTHGDPRPFVATDLPDGFALAGVADLDSAVPSADQPGPLLVFGSDPGHPELGVIVQDSSVFEDLTGGEAIEVGGAPALAYDGLGLGRRSVVVLAGDRSVVLLSPTLDRADLVRLAQATSVADDRPVLVPSSLPSGWRLLGESWDALGLASPLGVLRGAPSASGSVASYAGPTGRGGKLGSDVAVWSSSGDELSVHLAELFVERAEPVSIHGEPAVLGTYDQAEGLADSEHWVVSWLEADGEVVRVQATGLDRTAVLAIAQGVAPVEPDAWEDLLRRTELDSLGADDPGYDELASGAFADGTRWRLLVPSVEGLASGEVTGTRLSVATTGENSSSEASSGSSAPDQPFRTVETLDKAGRHFVSGLLGPDVVEVELRGADGSSVARAHVVAKGNSRAWVAELLVDPTIAVALASDGTELARITFEDLDQNMTVGLDEQTATTIGD
ncbi:MAG: hypothetical protein JWM47_1825 [Acidimicrobiales bacterium]|nr:hypothetical protein [Acidimicrobiales bacterium]